MSNQNKLALAIKYLFNPDYRDYRRVRILNVFDPDYFETLLKRDGREDLLKGFENAQDPFWFYFQISRGQLGSVEISSDSWTQLLDPCPLFDTYFYLANYRDLIGSRHPFSHYLLEGWKAHLRPSPFFDPLYYKESSTWTEADGNPLIHYLSGNIQREKDCSIFFSHEWYLDNTPLPKPLRRNAIKHYKLHGALAGKSPIPVFDPVFYSQQLQGQTDDCTDPLLHYLSAGEKSGLAPCVHFDPSHYRSSCQSGRNDISSLAHYLSKGVFRKCEVNEDIVSLQQKPIVSIIVPVYNPKPEFLNNCIRSVLFQTYPHWELWLVDDFSTEDETRDILVSWASRDQRINCLFNDRNNGIAATTQRGVSHANGEYIGFLDNDDELAPDCLFRIIKKINDGAGEIFYTDEDLIGDDGSRHAVFCKPSFNRALLYSHNYITHFVVVTRTLIDRYGGLNSEFDGAQDYDLILRLTSHATEICHIPRILYHWRAVETSTSISHQRKPYAHEAGKKALQNILQRNNREMQVVDTDLNYHYSIRIELSEEPQVVVVVPEGLDPEQRKQLAEQTHYTNCTIRQVPIDIGAGLASRQADSLPVFSFNSLQHIIGDTPADFISILGYGAPRISPGWLGELVSKATLEEDIAIVCGRVSYAGEDGPSFAVPDLGNRGVSYFRSFVANGSRHACGLHNLQYVNGCDINICLIHRNSLLELGGFDLEPFPRFFTMLDLCYRVLCCGKKILYTPDAVVSYDDTLFHDGVEYDEAEKEKYNFQQRHREQLAALDKWYNFGLLATHGISRDEFLKWLTGVAEQTTLDVQTKLK